MDVRCERCQAEYVFGDDQVGPAGLRVRCSSCGHVFTLKGRQPAGAQAAVSPRPAGDRPRPLASGKIAGGGAGPAKEWTLRKPGGEVYPCRDLATLQRWIVERKAARDDELSRRGGPFVALGALPELAPFFAVVDDLDRALAGEAVPSDDEGAEPVAPTPSTSSPLDGTAARARANHAGMPIASVPEPRLPPDLAAGPDHVEPQPAVGAAPDWKPEPKMPPGPAAVERAPAAEPGRGTDEHALPALGTAAESEPAWTSARPERGERAGVEMPRPLLTRASGGRRKSTGPLLLLVVVAVAAAGVYLARPAWLGLGPEAPETPEPHAGAGVRGPAPAAEASPARAPETVTPPPPARPSPTPADRAAAPAIPGGGPAPASAAEPATASPAGAPPVPTSDSPGPAPAGAIPPTGAPAATPGLSGAPPAEAPAPAAPSPAQTTSVPAPAQGETTSASAAAPRQSTSALTPAPGQTSSAPASTPGQTHSAPPATQGQTASAPRAAAGQMSVATVPTAPAAPPAKPTATGAGGVTSMASPGPAAAAPPPVSREDGARSSAAATEDGKRPPTPDAEPEPQESDEAAAEAPAPAAPPPRAAAPRPRPGKAATADRAARDAGGVKRLLAEGRRLRERGRPDAALRVYARVLEADPGSADALAGRGLCYLDLSQYAPAEASFGAALKSEPKHAAALMGLAETYRYEGRRADAVSYYRRYLTAHPDGGDAVAARNAIDALQESP